MSTPTRTPSLPLALALLLGAGTAWAQDPPATPPAAGQETLPEAPADAAPAVPDAAPAPPAQPPAVETPARHPEPPVAPAPPVDDPLEDDPNQLGADDPDLTERPAQLNRRRPAVARPAADRAPRLRLSASLGMHFPWDEGHATLYEPPATLSHHLELDLRIFDTWWFGLGLTGSQDQGQLYDTYSTRLNRDAYRVHTRYRRELGQLFALNVRGGAALWRTELKIAGRDDTQWHPGIFAGGGIEFLPFNPRITPDLETFSIGFTLDLLYDQVWPTNHTLAGTDLGALDASGLGWTLGVIATF